MEGDNRLSDWWEWEQAPGRIAGGGRSGAACGWWDGRAEDDLAAARASGQNAHRLSLEWSRLEIADDVWNDGAFTRYRRLLEWMRREGLTPMVTLYHFTLPRWVAERGGWSNSRTPQLLGRLAEVCADRLGDLVPLWITVNEPFSLLYHGYFTGRWPPGRSSWPSIVKAGAHLLEAHALAYRALKKELPEAQVGIAHIMQRLLPAQPGSPADRLATQVQDHLSLEAWLAPLRSGLPLLPWSLARTRIPDLAGSFDFLGVNYYGTYEVRFDPRRPTLGRWVHEGGITHGCQDWGRPDAEGLLAQLRRASALGRPLYVTENGVYDPSDLRRRALLPAALRAVHQAIGEGCDVRGYFHWTLVDNFEWAEGWETPFGLLALDPVSGERTPRESLRLYGGFARANAVPAGDDGGLMGGQTASAAASIPAAW